MRRLHSNLAMNSRLVKLAFPVHLGAMRSVCGFRAAARISINNTSNLSMVSQRRLIAAKGATGATTDGGSETYPANPMSDNLYERLGIQKGATQADIKAAFRRLAKVHHPDSNPNDKEGSEERFRRITEAKDILNNTAKRKIFDETGSAADAKDPRRYMVRKRAMFWGPIIVIFAAGFVTWIARNMSYKRKSNELRSRLVANFLGILAVMLVLRRFFGSLAVVYFHYNMYKDEMNREVADHVVVSCATNPQNNSVMLNIIPEDDRVLGLMKDMYMEIELPYEEKNEKGEAVKKTLKLEPNIFKTVIPMREMRKSQAESKDARIKLTVMSSTRPGALAVFTRSMPVSAIVGPL